MSHRRQARCDRQHEKGDWRSSRTLSIRRRTPVRLNRQRDVADRRYGADAIKGAR